MLGFTPKARKQHIQAGDSLITASAACFSRVTRTSITNDIGPSLVIMCALDLVIQLLSHLQYSQSDPFMRVYPLLGFS